MLERGVEVDHSTINRWVLKYAPAKSLPKFVSRPTGMLVTPTEDLNTRLTNLGRLIVAPELDKRIRPHLSSTNDSWRVDETYIEVKGEWKYLYRAVDSAGNTLDFM